MNLKRNAARKEAISIEDTQGVSIRDDRYEVTREGAEERFRLD